MINKDKLLNLVADLVEKLFEYGCSIKTLVETLKYYGFTEKQIKKLYGLEITKEDTDNE